MDYCLAGATAATPANTTATSFVSCYSEKSNVINDVVFPAFPSCRLHGAPASFSRFCVGLLGYTHSSISTSSDSQLVALVEILFGGWCCHVSVVSFLGVCGAKLHLVVG
jgi:hypothetical protein